MNPTNTKFLSRVEAETLSKLHAQGLVSDYHPPAIALISINSPNDDDPKEAHLRAMHDGGEPQVDSFWKPLKLMFNDIDPSGCGDEFLSKYVLFDNAMAAQVLDYLTKMETEAGVFACWSHCQAGVSRSAGVSKFVAEIYKLWYPETYRLYNKHVYSVLKTVYNSRVLTGHPVPGILHI